MKSTGSGEMSPPCNIVARKPGGHFFRRDPHHVIPRLVPPEATLIFRPSSAVEGPRRNYRFCALDLKLGGGRETIVLSPSGPWCAWAKRFQIEQLTYTVQCSYHSCTLYNSVLDNGLRCGLRLVHVAAFALPVPAISQSLQRLDTLFDPKLNRWWTCSYPSMSVSRNSLLTTFSTILCNGNEVPVAATQTHTVLTAAKHLNNAKHSQHIQAILDFWGQRETACTVLSLQWR
jgi:hypothetical protein